jgi:phosphoribosyl-ATP pyrophosphohydrolase
MSGRFTVTRESPEILDRLFGVIAERMDNPRDGSYTTTLFAGGVDMIGSKVLEEAAELVEAAREKGPGEVIREAADLVYHAWVLLAAAGVSPEDVRRELARREGLGGLEEKKSRSRSKIPDQKSKG